MGIYQELESRDINGYHASFTMDTGGPLGSNHVMGIRSNDDSEDWRLVRWFFFDEEEERYAWNFAEKVCTDKAYRERSINEEADWVRVQNLYEPLEKRLYDVLCEHPESEFPIMNREGSRGDKEVLTDCCQTLFEEIKSVIRDGKDKHPEDIFNEQKDTLETHLESKY